MTTTFKNKCAILSDLWINYRMNEELQDFVAYNDLGLPLGYFIHTKLVTVTDEGIPYVEDTFNHLCMGLDMDPNGEYESLSDLMTLVDDDED